MLGSKDKSESRKPKYSRFTQQELPACRLLLTPAVVIQSLFVVGAIFIPLGAVSLMASNQVVEVVQQYDDLCLPNMNSTERDLAVRSQNQTTCSLSIIIPEDMNPPIYVYYQLTNFYQNYRRYVLSQSEAQLSGSNVNNVGSCSPEDYQGPNSTNPITPCGLIAWSLFNDTFSIATSATSKPPFTNLTINNSSISWPSDRNVKFGDVLPQNFNDLPALRGGATLNTTLNLAQNLQVWMRTAALPTFRKLYGQINDPLLADSVIQVAIANQYNSYAYGGQKSLVLSTASWLGGKNEFLGIAYLTVGGICIFLSIVFFVLQFTNYRPLGDTSYLSWNRKAAEAQETPMPSMDESPDTSPSQ